jgi:hypothetical protein
LQSPCQLPVLDPWDPTILPYLYPAKTLECKRVQAELTYIDANSHLIINQTVIHEEGLTTLNCQYRCFDRVANQDVELSFGNWIEFKVNITLIKKI